MTTFKCERMTISAAQIREARKLLRRSSARIARSSGVFTVVLKAQLDKESGSVDPVDLRAIEQSLKRAGIEFAEEGVRLRKTRTRVRPHQRFGQ